MRRKAPRSSGGSLADFLDALAEDVLGLPDWEVRAEAREDGESLDDDSAWFRAVVRRAEAAVRSRQPSPGDLPISSGPISSETAAGLPGVERITDPHGPARRGSRPVSHYSGDIDALLRFLPEFERAAFRSEAAMAPHPVLQLVLRRQREDLWSRRAIGAVSRSYALVQHRKAVELCLRGFELAGLRHSEMQCELTLSELGEWMNFSFFLPDACSFRDTYGHDLDFRCDVSNSVDGTSPLKVRFNWFRQICSNGMIVGEKRRERVVHRIGSRMDTLADRIFRGFAGLERDRETLDSWQRSPVSRGDLEDWADGVLRKTWDRTSAGRVFSICHSGRDMEFPRGKSGAPSELGGRMLGPVPGSPERATTFYDVAQALSWVASRNRNIVTRIEKQAQIPELLGRFRAA